MNSNLTHGSTSTRRRRMTVPSMDKTSGDAAVVKYRTEGATLAAAASADHRLFIGGNTNGLQAGRSPGPIVVSCYNNYRFMPGTRIKWEPSVGSTATGRLYYCFLDNSELIARMMEMYTNWRADPTSTNYNTIASAIRSVGNCESFPIWMEKEITFPTYSRKKQYSVETQYEFDYSTPADRERHYNTVDRTTQKGFFYIVLGAEAPSTGNFGSFWYHDVVQVQGVCTIPTFDTEPLSAAQPQTVGSA